MSETPINIGIFFFGDAVNLLRVISQHGRFLFGQGADEIRTELGMQIKERKRRLPGSGSSRVVQDDFFAPFGVQQIFVRFDLLRFDHFRIDKKRPPLGRCHHEKPLARIDEIQRPAAPLFGIFYVRQNQRGLDGIQHACGKQREQARGGAGDDHIPEILPGAALGGKARTDARAAISEILHRDTVFLLERLDQHITAVGADRTDDGDFAFLFCRRQDFLPLLAET